MEKVEKFGTYFRLRRVVNKLVKKLVKEIIDFFGGRVFTTKKLIHKRFWEPAVLGVQTSK